MSQVRKQFHEDDKVQQSETTMIGHGIMFYVDEELQARIDKFEKKYEALVYHVIFNNTEFGAMYSLLYVSKHKSEWERDHQDIESQCPMVYVLTEGDYSNEFGSIGVAPVNGGLARVS